MACVKQAKIIKCVAHIIHITKAFYSDMAIVLSLSGQNHETLKLVCF